MTVDWNHVAKLAVGIIENGRPDPGQRDSLAWIVERLRKCNGVVLADEVGTGKTRIACAVIQAVIAAGGRVATVVPKGLLHQWVAESRTLDSTLETKSFTTLPELFRNANHIGWKKLAPNPGTPEWCALSHNFQAPQLHSQVWRAALPALVELELTSKQDRGDGRTREGRLAEWLDGKDENTVKRWAYWRGMRRIAEDVAQRVKKLASLRSAIRSLPDIRISYGDPTLNIGDYRTRDGEGITEQLLGIWLGEFDLVVVDEAHKSRGEIEEESAKSRTERAKVLVRLLGNILVQPPESRRLCVTATPMELDVSQWEDLLRRAHVDIGDTGTQVIKGFKRAAEEAALAPDEIARLDALRKASTAFTKTLRPYVTRRRRSEDRLLQLIKATGAGGKGPHPHRDIEPLRVSWTDPAVRASAWVDVLFAAECMSHAARGLSADDIGNAAKTAYTKLCSGHVSDFDLDGDDDDDTAARLQAPDNADLHTRGKIARVNYWREQLLQARNRVSAGATASDDLIDSEHPRITLAVREIEAWTEGTAPNSLKNGEKVLVFGVYVRPLTMLRDVLNIRYALRAADAGRPIAHAFDKDWTEVAVRQLDRMRDEGTVHGRLAHADVRLLLKALRDAHEEYERLQARLRRSVGQITERWFAAGDRLGGITDKHLAESVRSHAMAFVLDHFLSDASAALADRVNERDRVELLAEDYYIDHIAEEIEDTAVDVESDDDAREIALRTLFGQDAVALQRRYAVLLDGNTHSATRRYIQAAFNRRTSSPRVLIAQSQVGREGLNLHEACRVVLQFHAEWNPAILEQQIGRVDRKNSLWEELANAWLLSDRSMPLPRIKVRQLVFEGTYDAFQWERVGRRQHLFNASLFGALLAEKTLERVPSEKVEELAAVAPDFRPPCVRAPVGAAEPEGGVNDIPRARATDA